MASSPPVIPEIAKAYENDPRTKLALAAMAAGQSTAPVAAGKYGMADGIARMLQGLAGAYSNGKQEDKYTADQATLLAQRKARGVDGLSGAAPILAQPPAPLPMSAAGAVDENGQPVGAAPAIAAALGSPPPAQGPPGPALGLPGGIPTAPIPAPGAGGGPVGRVPFGAGSASGPQPSAAPVLAPPAMEDIPAVPAPVARPAAPNAVVPVRSRLLDTAYRIMADANPYESASGQDTLMSGLAAQDKMNEGAAERQQRLADMGYSSDLGQYAAGQEQDRGAAYAARTAAETRNFERGQTQVDQMFKDTERGKDQTFKASQSALERAKDITVAKINHANDGSGSSTDLTPEERAALSKAVGDGRVDLKGVTKFQAKVVAQTLVDNPNLDAIHLHSVATLAANPAAQQKAMLVQAVPTVLANVRDAGKKLNFSDAQFLGNLQAWGKGQFNDPDFTSYMSQRIDAMQTLAQVMSGVGATDMRTKMEAEAAPKTMSPKAWDGWYQGQVAALRPRIEAYEKARLLPPGTAKTLDAVTQPAANGGSGGWGSAVVVKP